MTGVALAEVADVNPRVSSKPSGDDPVAFVPMAELDAVSATTSSGETRSFSEVSKGYTLFEDGDLLIAKITPCFENNKIGQARLHHPVGVGSSEFHVVRPNRELVDDRYLLHFLRQDSVRIDGERRMTGSGGQRRVPPAFLNELKVPLPPLDHQRRIAAILDQADTLRRKRHQALEILERLLKSTFANFFLLPAASTVPLGHVANKVVVGHVGPTSQHFRAEGVPFLRTGNVGDGQVVRSDLSYVTHDFHSALKKSQLRSGDVLISRVITNRVRAAIVPPDLDGANCANIIVVRPSENILGETILGFLGLASTQGALLGRKVGSAQGVVNTTVLKELIVPVHSVKSQRGLADRVQAIRNQRSTVENHSEALEVLFKSLQSRAFDGGI